MYSGKSIPATASSTLVVGAWGTVLFCAEEVCSVKASSLFSLVLVALSFSALILTVGCSSASPRSPGDDAGAQDDDDTGNGDVTADDDDIGDDDSGPSPLSVEESGGSYLCTPKGSGPYPGVLYNHGGLGDVVGGDLEGTCRALAEAGYLAYAKKRRETTSLAGHLDDVLAGVDTLLGVPDVDDTRLGVLGFSRGGLLSLQLALERPELWDAVVLMAPAPGNGAMGQTLEDVSALAAPVLLLVSENDTFQSNHVQINLDVEAALLAAGKEVEAIVYPPFADDGHTLFFEVGDYWPDVLSFLSEHIP
ncbi:MAG: hypothetical protein CL928_10070 [Deltaproteobacteria bacterium]|nr:hypothetical protein [Deltaproteobacteria bacterium]